ncbi:hypothetical protein Tco_0240583 [Tanacetum coccineum]
MSSDDDVPSWGIPLIDAYESDPEAPEAALQSPEQAPLSPAHALPVEEHPEEDPEEDPGEDPSKEEEEELLALPDSPTAGIYIDLPFDVEEDEVPSTPPSPTSYHHISPLSQTGLCSYTCTFITTTITTITFIISITQDTIPPLRLPPPTHRDIIPEADMLLWKTAIFDMPS